MEKNQNDLLSFQTVSTSLGEDASNEKMLYESKHLTDTEKFFPELVWIQVLQKIKSARDIEKCSNSSPFFLKFLQKKREAKVVLPKVFVLLVDYFNERPTSDTDNDSDNMEVDDDDDNYTDVDSDYQVNPMDYVLKCRKICKSWNHVIEDFYQNRNSVHFMLKFEMGDFTHLKFNTKNAYTFHSQDDFQDFLQHFDATHFDFQSMKLKRNPFVERAVHFIQINLRNPIRHRDQLYINEIVEILTKYGTEVWYATFDFHVEFGESVHQFYAMLSHMFSLTPNLKVLRLNYTENFTPFQIPNALVEMGAQLLRNLGQDALRQFVAQNPLPCLPNLKFIDSQHLPSIIFNELIKKSCNITQLQVDRKDYHLEYDIFNTDLPKLAALNVRFCTIADFEKFENCAMPLNIKRFYFWYDQSSPFFPWSRLFHLLENKLGENCEELLLQLPMPRSNEQINQVLMDSHSCRLNLPNLQRITIFDDMAYCLDFLLPCKLSLQSLLLRYSNDSDANAVAQHNRNRLQRFEEFERKQAVKFLGYKEKMEESNIWGEFTELGEVVLHRNREMGGCISYYSKCMGSLAVHKHNWYRES